jgi:transcriptional regulator with XRE-family HTH domain
MGKASQPKPAHLARKLKQAREKLKLSQNGLIALMGLTDELTQAEVSAFERGKRVPPLPVLLKYSEVTRVWMNAFVDDDVKLPERLPASQMIGGIRGSRK